MSEYREECIKRKAVQIGAIEQRPVSGKSGKVRPVIVDFRYVSEHPFERSKCKGNPWTKWKAYRNEAEATEAMESLKKKRATLWEFRIRTVIAPTKAGEGK